MAIYHFTVKILSRSDRNTVESVAYRAGVRLKCERTGLVFDYRKKLVQHVELIVPQEAPSWIRSLQSLIQEDRQKGVQAFSDLAEEAEKRDDSQVYREFEFALPMELTDSQNIELAREFLKDQCAGLGISVLGTFHFEVDKETGELRPHCHAVLLMREGTEEGLNPLKNREWNTKKQLLIWREQWAQYVNFHLKMHGFHQRVDHRSYADQGIEMEPQPKLSRGVQEREKRSTSRKPVTDKGQAFQESRLRNLYQLLKDPTIVLKMATRNQVTFTWEEVQKILFRYVDDPQLFQRLENKLLESQELVNLENKRFTTKTLLLTEKSLIEKVRQMASKATHPVRERKIERGLSTARADFEKLGRLSPEQCDAQLKVMAHLLKPDQLSCIEGYAGTGKTTLLKALQAIWQEAGYQVRGIVPTGQASQILSQEGIPSQTVDQFLKGFAKGRNHFKSSTILVLDEAGMVDVSRMNQVLEAVQKLKLKLVVVGDGQQLQAVEAGDGFRLIRNHMSFEKLETVVRQEIPWQQQATVAFGQGQPERALRVYLEKGHFKFIAEESSTKTRTETLKTLLKSWEASIKEHPHESSLMLAHRRVDVRALNEQVREVLRKEGKIQGLERTYQILDERQDDFGRTIKRWEERHFAKGDRLIFLRNDNGLGVSNGSLGTIVELNSHNVKVKLQKDNRIVSFAPKLYPYFDQGYALTIYKSQGTTIDRTFVLGTSHLFRNLSYVALSRHRKDVRVFVSDQEFKSSEALIKSFSRHQAKTSSFDSVDEQKALSLVREDERFLRRLLDEVGNQLYAAGYVTREAFKEVKERFLGRQDPSLSVEKRDPALKKVGTDSPLPNREGESLKFKEDRERRNLLRQEIFEDLSQEIDLRRLSKDLIPNFQRETKNILEFKGGVKVNLQKGQWYSFTEAQGGGALQLIKHYGKAESFKEILHIARDYTESGALKEKIEAYLGERPFRLELKNVKGKSPEGIPSKEASQEEAILKIKAVQDLFEKSIKIDGTQAETYLKHERGIQGGLPDSLRYVPPGTTFTYNGEEKKVLKGALLSIAQDKDGELRAVQVTYLKGGKRLRNKEGKKLNKMMYGASQGAFVTLQKEEGPIYLAEGVETALSLKEAGVQGTLLASLGVHNLKNLALPGKEVFLCADYDGQGAQSHDLLLKAKEGLQERGYDVQVLWPTQEGNQKIDFNDILIKEGKEKVVSLLENQTHIALKPSSHELIHLYELASFQREIYSRVPEKDRTPHEHKELETYTRESLQWAQEIKKDAPAYHLALEKNLQKRLDQDAPHIPAPEKSPTVQEKPLVVPILKKEIKAPALDHDTGIGWD